MLNAGDECEVLAVGNLGDSKVFAVPNSPDVLVIPCKHIVGLSILSDVMMCVLHRYSTTTYTVRGC